MGEPNREPANAPAASPPGGEKAHAALVARLAHLYRKPVKPPKSLQPTPEACKSKIMRLRRKRRLLLQKSKRDPRP